MLFHDSSFTMEQDRYIQDDIDWTFPEIVMSPLSIIDVIDKHIPQVQRKREGEGGEGKKGREREGGEENRERGRRREGDIE